MQQGTDEALVTRAAEGDVLALGELLDRHLHPAWRLAVAVSPDLAGAEAAVVAGVTDALLAATRHPEPGGPSLRTRVVAGVHRTAAGQRTADRKARPEPGTDPVAAAFATLQPTSRTALWLSEVEGGTAEQIAPVLGIDRSATAKLIERAATSLRDRVAADAATLPDAPADCARALGKLPLHAAGKLTPADQDRISTHLAGCGACAGLLASVVAPRPALRRIVVPIPDSLPLAIAERWASVVEERQPWLQRWGTRAVSTAAAALVVAGLIGAAFVRRGNAPQYPDVASSAADTPRTLELPTPPELPAPVVLPARTATSSAAPTTGHRGPSGERPRSANPTDPAGGAPAPAPDGPSDETAAPVPAAEEPAVDATQATVDLGLVQVALGDQTGVAVLGATVVGEPPAPADEPVVEVAIPGLPPVVVPPPALTLGG